MAGRKCNTSHMLGALLIITVWINSASHVESSTTGGQCYSQAQNLCHTEWAQLWSADIHKQYADICKYFGTVHTCIMKYMKTCNFKLHEKELYEADIVSVYTKKPFSCHLIGGNLEYKAEYQGSSASTFNNRCCQNILVSSFIVINFYFNIMP